jgi:acylphosphatase
MTATHRIVARHIVVSGRVQGVFFRDWTERAARGDGIAGWVRNRANGTVEIVAEGEAGAIARFVEACRHGPDAARVDEIEVSEIAPAGAAGFERRQTG